MVNVRDSRSTIAEASTELPAHTIWLRMSSSAWRPVLLSAASLAIALCTWQFLSTVLFNPFLIPPPLEVFRTAIPMLASGEILNRRLDQHEPRSGRILFAVRSSG